MVRQVLGAGLHLIAQVLECVLGAACSVLGAGLHLIARLGAGLHIIVIFDQKDRYFSPPNYE